MLVRSLKRSALSSRARLLACVLVAIGAYVPAPASAHFILKEPSASLSQDAIGSPVTPAGVLHIALAAVESLGSLAAIALAALDWRKRGASTLFRFSAICFAVVLLTGPLAGLGAAYNWPVMGLFERITIGAFEVWLFATAGVQYLKAL